jgi:hypothetical protein
MSNIYQHNFDNCMKMRLSNSDYWDLFLCYDCTDSQDNDGILSECILVDIDINNDDSFSGDTVCSLTSWSGLYRINKWANVFICVYRVNIILIFGRYKVLYDKSYGMYLRLSNRYINRINRKIRKIMWWILSRIL